MCGHSTVLDVLLEYGADLSVADKHQAYPIHYAAQMTKNPGEEDSSGSSESEKSEGSAGYTRLLKKLLANNVSPEVRDKDERTPIIWAASAGQFEMYNTCDMGRQHWWDAEHCDRGQGSLVCRNTRNVGCQCR